MDKTRLLLNTYLDGTCTPEEMAQVALLLEQPETEALLHDLMEERAARYEAAIPDTALAEKVKDWEQQVISRIDAGETQPVAPRISLLKRISWLRHAAIWIGFLVLGALTVWQYRKVRTEQVAFVGYMNQESFPVRYLLPDSSVVFIGAGSRLQYPQQFSAGSREVRLSGVAFFDVKPDRQRPFTVQTGTMQTRILGTSFKIEAEPQFPLVVSVATGKVAVSDVVNDQSKELAILTPGRKLVYDSVTHICREGKADVDGLQQWIRGDLVYDEQPLGMVMRELEKRYKIKVSFAGRDIEGYRISGSFERGQDVRSVMTMLSVIGKFRYSFVNDQSVHLYK